MTLRKLFGLATIGGLLYAHRKHGGEMNVESFKRSGRDLLDGLKNRADEIRTKAEGRLHDAASRVAGKTGGHEVEGGEHTEDVTGYGSSGFGYRRS